MSDGRAEARTDVWAALVLLAGVTLFLWPYLFVWPTPLIFPVSSLGTDLPREVWPLAYWIKTSLAQSGEWPLWRPYLLSGAPLIGHPVAPVLYPPNWLIVMLPLALGLNVLAALHLWWAGLGVYLCLRKALGFRPLAAMLPALLFAGAPKWLAHLSGGHWPTLAAIVWWPWAWLAFAQFWNTGRIGWALLLGMALAAQALNHGTYFALSVLWLAPLTLWKIWVQRLAGLRRALGLWGGAGAITVGLTAAQLWPLLELLPYTGRTALTLAEAGFGSLPPALLPSLLFAPQLKFPEWFVYPGAGLGLLAAWGWVYGWTRHERLWLGAAVIGVVMSLGTYTPLYGWLYQLPGFSLFRNPSRWSLLTFFALCVLVAFSVERWLSATSPIPRRRRLMMTVLLAVYVTAGASALALPGVIPFDILPTVVTAVLAGGLLYWPGTRWRVMLLGGVLFAELMWVSTTLLRPEAEAALTQPSALTELLHAAAQKSQRSLAPYRALSPSTVAAHDLRTADGYDPFQFAAYAALLRRAVGCDFTGYAVAAPPTQASPEAVRACPRVRPDRSLLALLNVRYLLLTEHAQWPEGERAHEADGFLVYDLGSGIGPAFGVAQWVLASPASCLDELQRVDVNRVAIVETAEVDATRAAPPEVLARVARVNGETLTVRVAEPGLLIRSEAWAPGWRVWVDGAPAEVRRVNCALQGVWLPPGAQQVEFEYAPEGFLFGRWVSAATVIGFMAWAGLSLARRRGIVPQPIPPVVQ